MTLITAFLKYIRNRIRPMPEPLEGITVIEMTIAIQGPAAALYLRDMGAEVIKIEPPIGDGSRYIRGRQNENPLETMSPQFVAVNRGKRSVCLDIHTDLGSRAVLSLLEEADVFLTNYRESALEKMGLSYDLLKARFPKLIYASVNGFGPKGPAANKAMLDGAVCARGGLLYHTGSSTSGPAFPGAVITDTAGAMQLALGVMTALLSKERYGCGQRVQTSALGASLWLQQWEITQVSMTGATLNRDGNHYPNIPGLYGVYETKDGGWITLAQVMGQEAWDALCIFMETWDLPIDKRFQTAGQRFGEGLTEADSIEIRNVLSNAFKDKTVQEWEDFLNSQPDIIWERVRSWEDVLEDEQNFANDYLTEIKAQGLGTIKTVGNLVSLSETPGSIKGSAPELGEGNIEILANAELTADQISEIEANTIKERNDRFSNVF